jgi:manganese efflux pump family protein
MIALVAIGLALGVDSFQIGLGLGLSTPAVGRRVAIALSFGVCDGMAALAGLAISQSLVSVLDAWMGFVGPGLIGLYGLYMIVVASYGSRGSRGESERWALLGLPVCLSADNLVVGVGLGMFGFPLPVSAGMLAFLSAALSFVGLSLGRAIGNRLPFTADFASGFVLVLIAALRAVEGF